MIPKVTIIILLSMVTIWYPSAAEDLPPVNEDNLDPDAAHVCKRTDKEGYTRKQSFTQYFTEKTNTWCLSIPPRCTEYRIASRTAYRIQTLYRDRVHYFCCPGYKPLLGINYCVPKCDYNCKADENQGYCVTPGNCKCNHGYSGPYCESGCASNRWGPNCTNTCTCGSKGSCDPYNGNCICHIGYTGSDCSQPCINSFGLNCAHQCVCENGATCNNINGKCTCRPGYYGAYCHKTCDPSTTGEQGCEQTCPCQNGGVCDAMTGACRCSPGYKGTYCTEACDKFHWGQNCMQNCSCNFGECDPATGKCSCRMGYAGERCEVKCPDGYYGVGCLTRCGCNNNGKCYFNSDVQQIRCNCTNTGFHGDVCEVRDCMPGQYVSSLTSSGAPVCINCNCVWATTDSCHPLTGTCSCDKGYHGNDCTEKCKMPFYGDKCQEVCKCEHGDCHHVTGQCSSCYAGYLGVNCTKSCPAGTWGLRCANTCECMNNATCHAKTGYCDCAAGFHGMRCENDCPPDKYGPHCKSDCACNPKTSECSPYTGMCHCKSGFTGGNCEAQCPRGFYGIRCRQRCDCDLDTSVCDPQTGTCRCKGGWFGDHCENQCHPNMWGPYCSKSCDCNGNGECDPDSGSCICYPGIHGKNCDRDNNGAPVVGMQTNKEETKHMPVGTLPLVIAVTVPSIILLLILAAVVFYFMRKVRRIKDENTEVFFQNHRDTMVPNGGTNIGVVNPTYDDDNLQNERRYPHLSQRASAAPPLPQRSDACGACVDTDDVKLRVSMDDKCRPVSLQYAEVDDFEDRYTTLKSVNGDTAKTTQIDDDDDDDSSCCSETQKSGDKRGFVNATYAETDEHLDHHERPFSSSHHSNHQDCPITTENRHHDHPDACNEPSNDIDHSFVKNKASGDYDFPSAEKGTSERNNSANMKPLNEYMNHKQAEKPSSDELLKVKTKLENPYDVPHSRPASDRDARSTNSNHYQTPLNSVYQIPTNNKPTNQNEEQKVENVALGTEVTMGDGGLEFVDEVGDFENVDQLESSLFDGSDRNVLLKPGKDLLSNSLA